MKKKRFNELNGQLRSLKQLKIQWKTMKINARKEVSLFKRATNKTGGGGRPRTPTNDVIEINELLNPAEYLEMKTFMILMELYIISASTSKDVNASEICIFTLEDITENIVKPDLAVCENIHLEKQQAGSTSVVTVVEDHIPAASQDNATDNKTQVKNNMETMTPKNIFKHIKNLKKSSKNFQSNNYVDSMVKYSKSLKDQEHQKRLEILEVELNIQKEKLKTAILEREILEIKKAKELM
ncbi:unnamed protein product [Euphydryas editha]|uniref:Regulatory protein zeste n=1 Tax=Euphydryas editha TaxID=104508 RepID=A0AAU9UT82_EUPED|nr:unnamed protein product [Euphydryas editha]